MFFFFFFFNDTATTEIYTLSLHDALPISGRAGESGQAVSLVSGEDRSYFRDIERLIGKKIEQQIIPGFEPGSGYHSRSEEHTSELQSRLHLVCRLLLEKKKKKIREGSTKT